MATQPLPGIDHVILLMFENRSFDNMLGAFYPSTPTGGGVPPDWSNPWPTFGSVRAWQAAPGAATQNMPNPDPNELYANMASQLNNRGQMQGFVIDYMTVKGGVYPIEIMQYFSAENVPVTHALATMYAASDRYFASGPVQTWPNRIFSLCGMPGWYTTGSGQKLSYLNNTEYPRYPLMEGQLDYPCVFEQLKNAGRSWRVYYDDEAPIAAVVKYVWDHWHWLESGGNVFGFEDYFFDDVKAGNLPTFTLIEPRYQDLSAEGFKAPNSNHPGSSSVVDDHGVPINVSCGERLLARVYNALAQSSLFDSTLLIVTYDEHGGVFDHVYPPPATSPFTNPNSFANFRYDQYGARVPALFVNPYVCKGLLQPAPLPGQANAFDHTSILATLRDQFGLASSLTPRVVSAPTFRNLIDRSRPPIPRNQVPVPACTWDTSQQGRHAFPIVVSALNRKRRAQCGGTASPPA